MNLVHFSSQTLARAAQITEKIETLENQLSVLLHGGTSIAEKQGTPRLAPKRRISSAKKAGPAAPQAAENGRGTLRPAVVSILKKSKAPLRTAAIYDALVAQGYTFTFKEAKKVLGIRLYKMLGVKPLGEGLFKAK
jgi:hypothetical protein